MLKLNIALLSLTKRGKSYFNIWLNPKNDDLILKQLNN